MQPHDAPVPGATLRAARRDDLPAIEHLLTEAGLPMDGVAGAIETFIVAEADGALVGVGGLELCSENALQRSVAVEPAWRARAIGRALVTRLIAEAEARGVHGLYLLTKTAERYFPSFGFARTARHDVPDDVRRSAEFRQPCPTSATVMVRAPGQAENTRQM